MIPIKLSSEARENAVASIKRYFDESMDQEIGDLKSGLLLDFFLAEIGPSVYNHAIGDAQRYFQEKAADLEGACYEKEFGYWS